MFMKNGILSFEKTPVLNPKCGKVHMSLPAGSSRVQVLKKKNLFQKPLSKQYDVICKPLITTVVGLPSHTNNWFVELILSYVPPIGCGAVSRKRHRVHKYDSLNEN